MNPPENSAPNKPAPKKPLPPPDRWYTLQFRRHEQIHMASSTVQNIKEDEIVLVNTDHGPEPAKILGLGPQPILTGKLADLHPILTIKRRANRDEQDKFARLIQREEEAFSTCLGMISHHQLPMKLIKVERFFNGSKIIFYFTADNRVDFRALVKDLVQEFRTRVEMRQVGVRHETKMIGGIGSCGRELCCSSFINNFAPVSIKMAKEQRLPLNPTKISGICNRLLCCLTYEFSTYRRIRKEMPRCGSTIIIDGAKWKVIRQNILAESLTVVNPKDRELMRDIPRAEWEGAARKPGKHHSHKRKKKTGDKTKKNQ